MESAREPRDDSPKGKRTLSRVLIGPARDLRDPELFHSLSLVAFLAWVGLGSDGLSSSCYGPEEAFLALGTHQYLAVFLALLMALMYAVKATGTLRVSTEGEIEGLDLHEHGFPAYPEYVVTGDDGAPKTIDDVPIGRRTLAKPARKMKSVG